MIAFSIIFKRTWKHPCDESDNKKPWWSILKGGSVCGQRTGIDHQLVSRSLLVSVRESIVQPRIISCLVLVGLTFANSQSSEKLDSWNWECSVGTGHYCMCMYNLCRAQMKLLQCSWGLWICFHFEIWEFLNLIILHSRKKKAFANVLCDVIWKSNPHIC